MVVYAAFRRFLLNIYETMGFSIIEECDQAKIFENHAAGTTVFSFFQTSQPENLCRDEILLPRFG